MCFRGWMVISCWVGFTPCHPLLDCFMPKPVEQLWSSIKYSKNIYILAIILPRYFTSIIWNKLYFTVIILNKSIWPIDGVRLCAFERQDGHFELNWLAFDQVTFWWVISCPKFSGTLKFKRLIITSIHSEVFLLIKQTLPPFGH